jgi:hypothetical protein
MAHRAKFVDNAAFRMIGRRSTAMRAIASFLIGAALLAPAAAAAQNQPPKSGASAAAGWQQDFGLAQRRLVSAGRNRYFILEPGFQQILESKDERLVITVLDETKTVDGVLTRVVEAKEWQDGKLHEISRNYFAIDEETKDVFYFGEDVDFYRNDRIVGHDGAWLAGRNGAKPGLMMPGTPKVGMRYHQEVAPGVAMDRAEIIRLDDTCKTRAGTFANCLRVREGSPLEPTVTEFKAYAPGVGIVRDADKILVKYGFVELKK